MINQTVQTYLRDASIPVEKRNAVYSQLKSGFDPNKAEAIIKMKYPDKYGNVSQNVNVGSQQSADESKELLKMQIQQAMPFGGIGVGIAKGALETGAKMGKFGAEKMGDLVNFISGKQIYKPDVQSEQKIFEALKAKNMDEQVGYGLEKFAEFVVPAAKVGTVVKGLVGGGTKALGAGEKLTKLAGGVGGVIGESVATTGVGAIQEGKVPTVEDFTTNLAFMGGAGVVGKVAGKVLQPIKGFIKEKLPSRLINQIIKPKKMEFNFGKNPGLAIAKEGIVGNSLEELQKGVLSVKNRVGQEIGQKVGTTGAGSNAQGIISDIINKYKNKITDPAAASLLQNKLDQLLNETDFVIGKGLVPIKQKSLTNIGPEKLHMLQQEIGNLTTWSGASYEKPVNEIFVKMYNEIGKRLDTVAPGVKKLQRRYSNLLGAQKAIENQITATATKSFTAPAMALGGIAGYQVGDTPQEKVQNAIAGFLLPKLAKHPGIRSRVAKSLVKESSVKVAPSAIRKLVPGIVGTLGKFFK